jgi:hypothetical protein
VIYLDGSKLGDAAGKLSAATSSSWDAATYKLVTVVHDDETVEQMYTNNTVHWSSPTVWKEAGVLSTTSWLRIIDTVDWHATGKMQYGDNKYYIMASDYTSAGSQVFYSYGEGGYGGRWNDWLVMVLLVLFALYYLDYCC